MNDPQVEIKLGPSLSQEPIFSGDRTRVHLRLEQPVEVTNERLKLQFDVRIFNPDGYVGIGYLSPLCPYEIFGSAFTCDLASCNPSFIIQLPWWQNDSGPITLPAGTPILMYRYVECDSDDCGHLTCEPRNQLRLKRRLAKMTEKQRAEWKTRNQRVRCVIKDGKPAPLREGDTTHLRTESEHVVYRSMSLVVPFDVNFDIPFGWRARCSISEKSGIDGDLKPSECLIKDGSSRPALELRLRSPLDVAELVIPRGTPLCKVEMEKYRCDCPRCRLLQNEDQIPNHGVDTFPDY